MSINRSLQMQVTHMRMRFCREGLTERSVISSRLGSRVRKAFQEK